MDGSGQELGARWTGLCDRLGAAGSAGWLWACLEAMYEFGPRAYHTLAHVGACLRVLDGYPGEVEDRDAVELALWWHDCVYDPRRNDNEERSAGVVGMVAREVGMGAERVGRVRRLVLATKHVGGELRGDERVVVDCDLSVLGAEEGEYDAYAAGVRAEYAFVDDAAFAAGRGAFLRGMLAREWVFATEAMRGRLEGRARGNMGRELAGLRVGP